MRIIIICVLLLTGCTVNNKVVDNAFQSGEEVDEPWGAKMMRLRYICKNPTGNEDERMITWCKDNDFDIQTTK